MKKVLISLLALVVLFTSCSTVASNTDSGTISVSGSSTIYMEPDMASFTVSAEATKETSEEARSETDRIINEAVSVLTEKYGVSVDDIKTNYLTLSPEYSYVDNQRVLVGQRGSQSIDISLSDINQIGPIVEDLAKINGISVGSITLDKKDKTAEIEEARVQAVQDALKKAETYANALGKEVGDVIALTDSSSPVPYNKGLRVEVAAFAAADQSYSTNFYSYDLTLSDSVSLIVEIQ